MARGANAAQVCYILGSSVVFLGNAAHLANATEVTYILGFVAVLFGYMAELAVTT